MASIASLSTGALDAELESQFDGVLGGKAGGAPPGVTAEVSDACDPWREWGFFGVERIADSSVDPDDGSPGKVVEAEEGVPGCDRNTGRKVGVCGMTSYDGSFLPSSTSFELKDPACRRAIRTRPAGCERFERGIAGKLDDVPFCNAGGADIDSGPFILNVVGKRWEADCALGPAVLR